MGKESIRFVNVMGQMFQGVRHKNVQCEMHMHFMIEIVFNIKGVLQVGTESKTYNLKAGEGLLFMPYEIHSYKTEAESECIILVFSPEFLEDFSVGKVFDNALFSINQTVMEYVAQMVEEGCSTSVAVKAMLYPLLSEFLKNNNVTENKKMSNEIYRRALSYIEKYYGQDISLKSAAKEIGCHYVYLSRNFSKRTGFSFVTYLNRFRVARSLSDLKSSNLSVTEIAYKNGFGSLRSYNRAFRTCMSMAPTEYREKEPEFHIG